MSLKVRSPVHVKWPHLRKKLNAWHSYTDWTIALKFSAINTSDSSFKMCNSEFWYWCPVRSILWPLHFGQVNRRKLKGASFGPKPFLTPSKHQVSGRIDTLNRKVAISDPSSWPQLPRSLQVMKAYQQFFGNKFYIVKLGQKNYHICLQADDTAWTCIDWYAIWPFRIRSWHWPMVKFWQDFLKSNYNSFIVSRREEHGAGKINVVPLLS